jgi:predicted porin
MNKTTLVALAICAGLPALAQAPALTVTSASGDSNVQVYGILDLCLARVDHSLSFDNTYPNSADPRPAKYATRPTTGMINGGISGNRFGLRGGTKINDTFKAIFNLEAGLMTNSGALPNGAQSLATNVSGSAAAPASEYSSDSSQSGQLFSRAAFFGVASDTCGTLTFGRNTSFLLDTIGGYDALQGAQTFTPIGYSGSYGGGGQTDNGRLDNSLKYRVKVGDVTIGLAHKFGGIQGVTNARGVDQVIVGYEKGAFGVQAIYSAAKDATSLANGETVTTTYSAATGTYTNVYANQNTVKVTCYDTKSYLLAARYKVADLALRGGWIRQEYTNPSNPGSDGNMTSIFGQQVSSIVVQPFGISGLGDKKTLDTYWLSAGYDVTKALNVAAGYYRVNQNDYSGTAAAAATAGPAKSGHANYLSLLVDYRLSKSFDTYAGYMTSVYQGGMAYGYALASNKVIGLGARYAF